MSELVEFLLARIAEDEAVAREASDDGHRWLLEEESISLWPDDREPADGFISFPRKAHAAHVVEWNPERVLAECVAKRAIIEEHQTVAEALGWDREEDEPRCHTCDEGLSEPDRKAHPCPTLRALASIYADHPDCREEWRQ